MKITTIILASLAFMSPVVIAEVADSAAPTKAAAKTKLPRGMKRYGGIIQVPNSQKGKIVIVNAQRKLPLSNIRAGMDEFAQTLKFRPEIEAMSATDKNNWLIELMEE